MSKHKYTPPKDCKRCGKPLGQTLREEGFDAHVRNCPVKKEVKKADARFAVHTPEAFPLKTGVLGPNRT